VQHRQGNQRSTVHQVASHHQGGKQVTPKVIVQEKTTKITK
jgi:hypothetical protein